MACMQVITQKAMKEIMQKTLSGTAAKIIPEISGYHAHVYFDADTLALASALCRAADNKFDLSLGRIHQKTVGPHPCWSCQLAFTPDLLGEVLPWLALNRQGLTIFIHPNTGDDYKDHSEYAVWMGKILPLKLDIFDLSSRCG